MSAMSLPSRYWADLSHHDFARMHASGLIQRSIAVLPVAATEQHGPHLPLSVDTVLVDGIIAAALAHLAVDVPVLFLPTQAIGLSPEHARFAGTLTLKNETVLRLWTDIAESVAAAGVSKLLLFNSHGGNVSVMDLVARDLRARLSLLVYRCSWFDLPLRDAVGNDLATQFDALEHRFGIHAGAIETSMMLALQPQRVDMAQARDFASSAQQRAKQFDIIGNGKSAKWGWQMQDYNRSGAVGNASSADGEKGRAWVDAAGRALAQVLVEIDRLPAGMLVDGPEPAGLG